MYNWVDRVPLTRPRKNISRDFSDGVLLAEVVGHFLPELVVLSDYVASNNVTVKQANWNHLNRNTRLS